MVTLPGPVPVTRPVSLTVAPVPVAAGPDYRLIGCIGGFKNCRKLLRVPRGDGNFGFVESDAGYSHITCNPKVCIYLVLDKIDKGRLKAAGEYQKYKRHDGK